MSLRATMAQINARKLRAALQNGDPALEAHVLKRIEKTFFDATARQRATEIATTVLRGQEEIRVEDDVVASVVVCIAQTQQKLQTSNTDFWNDLLNLVYNSRQSPNLWAPFFEGRPEIGDEMNSSWTLYALLEHEEARTIFKHIRACPGVSELWEYDEASKWMDEVESTGADVLFFAN